MKIALFIEFPSFLFIALFRSAFLSAVGSDTFFAGISVGGYELLATMVLSFAQWWLAILVIRRVCHKWSSRARTASA
jgi:hypothetical protein